MTREEKNNVIKESIRNTRLKRKNQTCKTFRFKIDRSSLSRSQKNSLKMMFIETKRLYNHILSYFKDHIFDIT